MQSIKSETDEQLWASVVLTDCRKSFTTLFDRYWSMIYNTAFMYTKDEQASECVTHDIFVNLWTSRNKLKINTFSAYLRMAARYHVYRELKNLSQSPLRYIDEWDREVDTVSGETADGNIGYQEALQLIHRAMSFLPARCQEIFRMSRFEHLSNDEIASKLGISKRSVENQISTALHFLRKKIKPILPLLVYFSLLC